MHNSEIERHYGRLSEDGKEAADYIGEMGRKVHTLSEDEERYAFWLCCRGFRAPLRRGPYSRGRHIEAPGPDV
jgi:hypothetical protein